MTCTTDMVARRSTRSGPASPTLRGRLRRAGVVAVDDPVARFAAAGSIELWPAIDVAVAGSRIQRPAPALPAVVATLAWPERPDAFVASLDDGCLGGELPLGHGSWLSCRGNGLELHVPGSLPETIVAGSRGRLVSDLVAIGPGFHAEWIVTSVRKEVRGRGGLARAWLVIEATAAILDVVAASDLIARGV